MKTERKLRCHTEPRRSGHSRSVIVAIGGLLWMFSPTPFASSIQSVVAAKIDPIPLYATPSGDKKVGTAPASSLPWKVEDDQKDFYKISLGGKSYWVDSMDVHADRAVIAKCNPVVGPKGPVAGEFNAGSDRCK